MYNAVIGIQTFRVLRIKFVLEERFLDYARNDAGGLDFSTALEMTFINQYDSMNQDDTNYLDSRL